jgi:GNAT superfamily N-acetyltransferase
MTDFTISAATTVSQARMLLLGATPPNSSFTQAGIFAAPNIARAYRLRVRKPEWTWFAADERGTVLGVVAGWGAASRSTAGILDALDLPKDAAIAAALLETAVADSTEPGRRSIEVIHFIESDTRLDDPDLASLIATLAASGFRLLVRRRRYRMPVSSALVAVPPTHLRFEPLASATDPRLPAVLGETLAGSLDAHDIAALARGDLETVAYETAAEFLEGDPWQSFFLAIDPRGDVVGLAVGGLRGTPDVGVASFIGVSSRHRGNGYAAQLLGWMTARLIAAGARTLIGETDDENFPMDAAFRAVGYPHTESRIDFVRDLGGSDSDGSVGIT